MAGVYGATSDCSETKVIEDRPAYPRRRGSRGLVPRETIRSRLGAMARGMALPLRRERMAERSRIDELEERATNLRETPSERLMLALELADLTRDLAESASAAWVRQPRPLEGKARLYVAPLRAATSAVR